MALLGKFQRVAGVVEQCFLEPDRIAEQMGRDRCGFCGKLQVFGIGPIAQHGSDISDQAFHPDILFFEHKLPGLDLGKFENGVEDAKKVFAGAFKFVHLRRLIGCQARASNHVRHNYSRKNRLYQAFRELGRVVRTAFLLSYISDMELREQITATTNKVEAYNGFSKWLFFGGEGIIADNDPEEQEKVIKYNDLVANAVIFHNVVDQTRILRELKQEGFPVNREDVATLSPYVTSHIKRFGDYIIDLDTVPEPIDSSLPI